MDIQNLIEWKLKGYSKIKRIKSVIEESNIKTQYKCKSYNIYLISNYHII